MATCIGTQEGSFSVDEKARRDGMWRWRTRSFSIEYIVISDNLDESWLVVETMADLPHIGDQKDGCRCKSYKLKETNTVWINGTPRFKWVIEYQYDSECGAENSRNHQTGQDETNPDPIQWPVEIGWTSQKIKTTVCKDFGNPPRDIANSAGQLQPQEIDLVVPCLTLSRYEPYVWGPHWITKFAQKTNSDEFMGYAAGKCLIDDIQAEREEINGGYYFKVTYKILFYPNSDFDWPWEWNIADRGTMMKDTKNYTYDPEHPDDNIPILPVVEVLGTAQEVDLDGYGHQLQEGADKVFLTFFQYGEVKFADLHFNLAESEIPEEPTQQPDEEAEE